MVVAKRILRYFKGTSHLGITYTLIYFMVTSRLDITYTCRKHTKANVLRGFADADNAGDPNMQRSLTEYATMMNHCVIFWSLTLQAIIALSSSEAEFYTASNSGCDVSHQIS